MKKFIVSVFIATSFLGCGGGGGSSAFFPPSTPILAEATTENAFKAYDAMSVSTYLPSLYASLYNRLTNGGSEGEYSCTNDGSISVKFLKLPPDATLENSILLKYLGSYEFHNCRLNAGDSEVLLDGKIISYFVSIDNEADGLTGYIKSGFKFEIKNNVKLTYKSFPFEDISPVMKYFKEDGKGSYFNIMYPKNGGVITSHFASYTEENLGDILYSGSFSNTLEMTGISSDKKGIIAHGQGDEVTNLLTPVESLDYSDKLLIHISSKEYFETDYSKVDADISMKAILSGRDDKNVSVWQKDENSVQAETENTFDTSHTVHTPYFYID
jgi:hypothetical protein